MDHLRPEMLPAIAWVHPVTLALIWGMALAFCTRVPAGEVDRGTIDVLLGLPVSRRQVWVTESLVWLTSGAVLVLLAAAGNRLGNAIANGPDTDPAWMLVLAANLMCLYVAVGGLTWFLSSLCDRRGRAIGIALAFVLATFLLNYLAPVWDWADQHSSWSLLHYYVPLRILRDGTWPLHDMAVLAAFGAVFWTAGGIIFNRRDLATV